MYVCCKGVIDGFSRIVTMLEDTGVTADSRLGKVLKFPTPILIQFTQPRQRVLISRSRCPNPFFHLAEVFWMLSGSNRLKPVWLFNRGYQRYSDDGQVLNGAYGHRWRVAFNRDQLTEAVRLLAQDRISRRVVIQMWNVTDLGKQSNDIPCHTHMYLWIEGSRLNLTVCNRSNDLVWGLFGSNFVHFTILQEWFTRCEGLRDTVKMGSYYVFSNNLHAYINDEFPVCRWEPNYWLQDLEEVGEDPPLIDNAERFSELAKELIDLLDRTDESSLYGQLTKFAVFCQDEPFVHYCVLNFAEYLNRRNVNRVFVFRGYHTWDRAMALWYKQKGYRHEITSP